MQQTDDIVEGWLSGSDDHDNPAGPLYIQGEAATEAALTSPHKGQANAITCSSCSFSVINGRHCACC
jgi:hypothetical protein